MKLLFDENLSPRLVAAVETAFPCSAHVHALGLGAADDLVVWQHARDEGYVIVTKDADYNDLSLIKGHPPKVVMDSARQYLHSGNSGLAVGAGRGNP